MTHPLPAELQGVSVKELVKALGKCVRYTAAHTCFNLSCPFCHVPGFHEYQHKFGKICQ